MEVKAHYRNARMAPRKLRTYRALLKGLPASAAVSQLTFMRGEAPTILLKTLKSAMANAQHNFDITADNLTVADIVVDGGFVMKRFQPVSKGRAHPILKRTSHVTVIVEEVNAPTSAKARKKRKTEIEELTAEDVAAGRVGGTTPAEEGAPVHDHAGHAPETHAHATKQEEAFQKMKMQQQGGDPKKSHRRKSMGE